MVSGQTVDWNKVVADLDSGIGDLAVIANLRVGGVSVINLRIGKSVTRALGEAGARIRYDANREVFLLPDGDMAAADFFALGRQGIIAKLGLK